jgi:hypothetical protein
LAQIVLTVLYITIRLLFLYSLSLRTVILLRIGILSELVGIDLCQMVMSFFGFLFFQKDSARRALREEAGEVFRASTLRPLPSLGKKEINQSQQLKP